MELPTLENTELKEKIREDAQVRNKVEVDNGKMRVFPLAHPMEVLDWMCLD